MKLCLQAYSICIVEQKIRGKIMKIAIDAMGGDHAPRSVVLGAMEAIKSKEDLHITLVGDAQKIRKYLTDETNISILHTAEVITADDEPVRAVRRKKNSSLVLAATEVKEGRAQACLSAGNTGALMSAGIFVRSEERRVGKECRHRWYMYVI